MPRKTSQLLRFLGCSIAIAWSLGCSNLAEDMATHLASQDFKKIEQDVTIIEGDLALFRRCLKTRGGTCEGRDSTALPHSLQHSSSQSVIPASSSGSKVLTDSLAALPAGHPAKNAHEVLRDPIVQQVAAVHDHLRGHQIDTSSGVRVERKQDPEGGDESTVTLDLPLQHLERFHSRLLSSIGTGSWAALHHHCQSVVLEHQNDPDLDVIKRTCRQVTYVRGYLDAYLRNGQFLKVDVQLAGVIKTFQATSKRLEGDIRDLQSQVQNLESLVGAEQNQATRDVSQAANALQKEIGQLVSQAQGRLTSALGADFASTLNDLCGRLKSVADQVVSQFNASAAGAFSKLAHDLLQILDQLDHELQHLQTEIASLDQRLVGDLNTELGQVNSKLSNVFRVSNVGFVSRDGSFRAMLPTLEVTLDPTDRKRVQISDASTGRPLTSNSQFTNLGLVTDTSGVDTGASIGAEMARVFLEAFFDAHEGLPAIAPANQGSIQPTGLNLAEESLPRFQSPMGNVDSHDLTKMTWFNDHTAIKTRVITQRILSGIGPFSLNNPSIEALVTELVATSVRKAIAKGSWCWYACNLDRDISHLADDFKKAAEDEKQKIESSFAAEKKKLQDEIAKTEARLKEALRNKDRKARASIEAEQKKLQDQLASLQKRIADATDQGLKRFDRDVERVKLRLSLGR